MKAQYDHYNSDVIMLATIYLYEYTPKDFTIGDILFAAERILQRVEHINKNSQPKKIIFKKGREILLKK